MNHNLLREDEQQWLEEARDAINTPTTYDHSIGSLLSIVARLLNLFPRLTRARAEKYEFAAQQLEELIKSWFPFDLGAKAAAEAVQRKIAELRRLANG